MVCAKSAFSRITRSTCAVSVGADPAEDSGRQCLECGRKHHVRANSGSSVLPWKTSRLLSPLEAQAQPDASGEIAGGALPAWRYGPAAMTNHGRSQIHPGDRASRRVKLHDAADVERELRSIFRPHEQHEGTDVPCALDALIGEARETWAHLAKDAESRAPHANFRAKKPVNSPPVIASARSRRRRDLQNLRSS